MKDYHINIFHSEEDEGYIADIPDLEACSAFGSTPEEALREVNVAKQAWLGGRARGRQARPCSPVPTRNLPSLPVELLQQSYGFIHRNPTPGAERAQAPWPPSWGPGRPTNSFMEHLHREHREKFTMLNFGLSSC